jgi:hypothetical protein
MARVNDNDVNEGSVEVHKLYIIITCIKDKETVKSR